MELTKKIEKMKTVRFSDVFHKNGGWGEGDGGRRESSGLTGWL